MDSDQLLGRDNDVRAIQHLLDRAIVISLTSFTFMLWYHLACDLW